MRSDEVDTGALARRNPLLVALALTASLSVLSWLRPLGATQTDVQLINGERLRRAIPVLAEDSSLDRVAEEHSQQMAAKGTIWHDPSTPDRVGPWTAYGENVGMGPDLESVHRAFMNSPEHRRNILEPLFRLVGTGIAQKDNTVYVTEIFLTRPKAAPRRFASKPPHRPVAPRKHLRAIPRPPRPRKPLTAPQDTPQTVSVLLRLLESWPIA